MSAFRAYYRSDTSAPWTKITGGKLMYASSPRAVLHKLETGFLTEGEFYKVEELQDPVFGYNYDGDHDGVYAEYDPPRVHYFRIGRPTVANATAEQAGDGA